MTEPIRPAAAKLFGDENWILVPAAGVADYTAPTATEITAVGALDITRCMFADSGKPSKNTNTVDQERRFGDTLLFQFIGQTTFGGGELHYSFDPQAIAGSDGKKVYEKLTAAGGDFVLINRKGVGRATAPATGQFVDSYLVEVGPSFPVDAGDGESAEAGMGATFVISNSPEINVALV